MASWLDPEELRIGLGCMRLSTDPERDQACVAALDPEARFLHCPHPAGPPTCWCRPPLPGLPPLFAREAQVDLSRSVLMGTGAAHRNLAAALGCRYEEA